MSLPREIPYANASAEPDPQTLHPNPARAHCFAWSLLLWLGLAAAPAADTTTPDVAVLPDGVRAVWDLRLAERERTETRERICLNGLWRWQPAEARSEQVPEGGWGYFKVPGPWPGITDYMQKDCQTVFPHPNWRSNRLAGVTTAWYHRAIEVPQNWTGRRVALSLDYLNSFASVFVDGHRVGEIQFPGGELDLTAVCAPGSVHQLALVVVAMPLKGVLLSYTDSASAREIKGTVPRRGLCGDVYLVSRSDGPHITDVAARPSVRRRALTVDTAVEGLPAEGSFKLRARVVRNGEQLRAIERSFRQGDLAAGRIALTDSWMPAALWDLHTPRNLLDLEVALLDERGRVLDTSWTVRFGFRECWIEGKDFILNGTRIFLSSVPFDNTAVGAAWANYAAARESMERLQSFGINYVYFHNYDCDPGSHLGQAEVLRAADDTGMLLGVTQPHFSHYNWDGAEADRTNGYARHAEYYVRAAQNHPSVVMYPMSHNATGYDEDMNPDLIDGIKDPRANWGARNVARALRAEAIVRRLDPDRIVYHHASGNLGAMHDSNFYPNFVPVQELSDWFEHWATTGVKPFFTCEYGAPFTWDWTLYRGWYLGKREFGSAKVPWEFCLAEWNAQFFGDQAYQISEPEKANLRWEARQFRAGNLWHRWDYPNEVGSPRFDERYPVFALYLTDNWRAFRTWSVSGISPWEHGHFWKLREGVNRKRQELKVDWDHLQRPGFSPDYVDQRYERMDLAFERSDWVATPAAQALLRNNRPLLAYLAGKPSRFTSKDHNFFPGENVEKQLIVINNSRESVTCEGQWQADLPQAKPGQCRVSVTAGGQERVPVSFQLPSAMATGRYEIQLQARFSNGETQQDRFVIDVLPRPPAAGPAAAAGAKIAVFDPPGETAAWLARAGIQGERVESSADLSGQDLLIIGKGALRSGEPAPDLRRVRDGLKVIVFEQTAEVLQQRLGFRVVEYGLRQVFPRVPDHPLVAGIAVDQWRDWRGEATIVPSRLKYTLRPQHGPTVDYCGLPVAHAWRCGNRGNVASVLVEKPARGDFLPIVDGGFGLQYSPLLEYHEGRGLVLFCQLDVTGRTEPDPVAEILADRILRYVSQWTPSPRRTGVYAGDSDGLKYLESASVPVVPYTGSRLTADQVLIVGPDGGRKLAADKNAVRDWLNAGGRLLALGLDQEQAELLLPFKVPMKRAEHISAFFRPLGVGSEFAGIGPSDLHNRDPRQWPLLSASPGLHVIGNGVLARAEPGHVIFCQLAPWQFGGGEQANLKRTQRRASVLLARLLANLGVAGPTPLLERLQHPVEAGASEKRWLDGLYLDAPGEWDDPYRFFRW